MSNKTITKKISFVIFFLVAVGIFSGCQAISSSHANNANRPARNVSADYEKPEIVGTIESAEITESSGLANSKCRENVFWTHNDSGGGAYLYAFDATGAPLGVWTVPNGKNKDWEDLAAVKNPNGECFLYIGDIGDNERKRDEIVVYKVREPTVSDADKSSTKKNPRVTEPAEAIKMQYPNARFDAETLIVQPQTGDIYVLTKSLREPARVYKLSKDYDLNRINQLEKIADFTVPSIPFGFLTGGDISADGRRVVIADYLAAYEIALPAASENFDDIWREKPTKINLGDREQGEAICYAADGKAIYATSERKNSPVIKVER